MNFDQIQNILDIFVEQNLTFSYYDVSNILDIIDPFHDISKEDINDFVSEQNFGTEYSQTTCILAPTAAEVIVYHPSSINPYHYSPSYIRDTICKFLVESAKNISSTYIKGKPVTTGIYLSSDRRLRLGKSVIKSLGAEPGDYLYVDKTNKGKVVFSTSFRINHSSVCKVDGDYNAVTRVEASKFKSGALQLLSTDQSNPALIVTLEP